MRRLFSLLIALCILGATAGLPSRADALCCTGQIYDDPGTINDKSQTINWFGRLPLPSDYKPTGMMTFVIETETGGAILRAAMDAKAFKPNGPGYIYVGGDKGGKGIQRVDIKPHNKMWRAAIVAGADFKGMKERVRIGIETGGQTYCAITLWRRTQSPAGWQEVDMLGEEP